MRAVLLSAPMLLAAQIPDAQTPKIVQPVVSQSEDGPPLTADVKFVPGEWLYFSFQAEGYKIGPNGKIQLKSLIEAYDPRGISIAPPVVDRVATSLADEDSKWKPKLRAQFQVPPIAPPGTYTIQFSVTDEQTKQTVSDKIGFPVSGVDVKPQPELVIRDLAFYRSEEEVRPLEVAAYRPGDTLWSRFEITGYKYGDGNAIDVSYDVAVLNREGKQIFAQANAAVERSKAYYPQPWVPGSVNLSLQSSMTRESYTLVITAHDAIGNQKAVAKAEFRLQ